VPGPWIALVEGDAYVVNPETGVLGAAALPHGRGLRPVVGTQSRSSRTSRIASCGYCCAAPSDRGREWELHHECENPPCVRPDHLAWRTFAEHRRAHPHGRYKLTEEDVLVIRATPKVRGSGVLLAERFGVGQAHISQLRR
jgi:hypothetical protein